MPSTPAVGWRELAYYDPPTVEGAASPSWSADIPASSSPPWRRMGGHMLIASMSRLMVPARPIWASAATAEPRDPKKSARLKEGQSAAGCVVLWGDPASAPHLLLAEGIETSAALALAHRAEIGAGELAVAAALSTSGIRAFVPWPATRMVTIAADRDEAQA